MRGWVTLAGDGGLEDALCPVVRRYRPLNPAWKGDASGPLAEARGSHPRLADRMAVATLNHWWVTLTSSAQSVPGPLRRNSTLRKAAPAGAVTYTAGRTQSYMSPGYPSRGSSTVAEM